MAIQGIAQTPFYRWITSDQGLSELGIPASEPPKLLAAYRSSFVMDLRVNQLTFRFGNTNHLIRLTPHPGRRGKGNLKIRSWLQWAVEGIKVPDRGFVARKDLPAKLHKRIRLNNPLGGLMLPARSFGSTGSWELPIVFRNYADEWFVNNKAIIERLINAEVKQIFSEEILK